MLSGRTFFLEKTSHFPPLGFCFIYLPKVHLSSSKTVMSSMVDGT